MTQLDGALTLKQRRAQPRQKRDKPVKVARLPIATPTPERMAKSDFTKSFAHHHETGTKTEAYIMNSWHTMMFNRGKLSDEQFRVIQKYCDQWHIAERSQIKSNLDKSISSGEGGTPFAYLEAQKNLRHWNARIGRIATKELVLVCCQGLGYMGAARALFGESAKQSDADRIKTTFIKTVADLDHYMD